MGKRKERKRAQEEAVASKLLAMHIQVEVLKVAKEEGLLDGIPKDKWHPNVLDPFLRYVSAVMSLLFGPGPVRQPDAWVELARTLAGPYKNATPIEEVVAVAREKSEDQTRHDSSEERLTQFKVVIESANPAQAGQYKIASFSAREPQTREEIAQDMRASGMDVG